MKLRTIIASLALSMATLPASAQSAKPPCRKTTPAALHTDLLRTQQDLRRAQTDDENEQYALFNDKWNLRAAQKAVTTDRRMIILDRQNYDRTGVRVDTATLRSDEHQLLLSLQLERKDLTALRNDKRALISDRQRIIADEQKPPHS